MLALLSLSATASKVQGQQAFRGRLPLWEELMLERLRSILLILHKI